jgi:hypothetical protein
MNRVFALRHPATKGAARAGSQCSPTLISAVGSSAIDANKRRQYERRPSVPWEEANDRIDRRAMLSTLLGAAAAATLGLALTPSSAESAPLTMDKA